MTNSHERVSATIYEFPARGRFALASEGKEKNSTNGVSPRVARTACGSGWYHDEAIEDAERSRQN